MPTPTIKSVKCAASCMSGGRVRDGGKVRLRGSRLAGVTRVVFTGARGPRDDAAVRVSSKSDRTLTVPVPFTAQSGRVVVYAGSARASSPKPLTIMPPPAITATSAIPAIRPPCKGDWSVFGSLSSAYGVS